MRHTFNTELFMISYRLIAPKPHHITFSATKFLSWIFQWYTSLYLHLLPFDINRLKVWSFLVDGDTPSNRSIVETYRHREILDDIRTNFVACSNFRINVIDNGCIVTVSLNRAILESWSMSIFLRLRFPTIPLHFIE